MSPTRTLVLASLLATGLSEWVQLPVVERREDRPRPMTWPGKYFNSAANHSRPAARPTTPPTAATSQAGLTKPAANKKASVSTVQPVARQHPILVLTYGGKTPRVQFVRPAIFVGNQTLDGGQRRRPGPEGGDLRRAKGEVEDGAGAAGLLGAMENPLDVLRKVHQSLKLQTPRTVLAKLRFLHNLKENMLSYVDQYLKRLWGPGKRRTAREAARRPSVEGSVMTMSFLMFGAFTVQLVQRVISNLGGGVTHGRRHKRSMDDVVASAKIMSFMEQYQVIQRLAILDHVARGAIQHRQLCLGVSADKGIVHYLHTVLSVVH